MTVQKLWVYLGIVALAVVMFGTALYLGTKPARAQEPLSLPGPSGHGTGVICDTPAEAELVGRLDQSGTKVGDALNLVNRRFGYQACGISFFEYRQMDIELKIVTQYGELKIVRLSITAGLSVFGWRPLPAHPQWSYFFVRSLGI